MNERLSPGFPPTRHSAVEAVRAGDAAARERGLQAIASAYWRPVYTYLRLHWRRPHEEAAQTEPVRMPAARKMFPTIMYQ